jgi:hypothetical protein
MHRTQRALWRGKTPRVKAPLVDVVAFGGAPIVAAALLGDDDVGKHRPQLLTQAPQQDVGLG